jgi:hypothetical protein
MTYQQPKKCIASIKAEFGMDGPTCYRVGFIDEKGNFEGNPLTLSVEDVQRVVFAHISFTIMGEATGVLLPCPSGGLAEDILDQMFIDERLRGRALDEVITEALDLSMNETSDQMVADLTQLRDRLLSSLAHVEAELGHHRAMQSQQDTENRGPGIVKGRSKNDIQ